MAMKRSGEWGHNKWELDDIYMFIKIQGPNAQRDLIPHNKN